MLISLSKNKKPFLAVAAELLEPCHTVILRMLLPIHPA
jgi:hypothetical protein